MTSLCLTIVNGETRVWKKGLMLKKMGSIAHGDYQENKIAKSNGILMTIIGGKRV